MSKPAGGRSQGLLLWESARMKCSESQMAVGSRNEKRNGMENTGWVIIKLFLARLRKDNVSAFAAQTAFFVVLSFLPFFIFLITILKFLPMGEEHLLTTVQSVFPSGVNEFIGGLLSEARQRTTGTVLSLSAVTALWSASRGVLAIVRGMNGVYGHEETRNYFMLRLLAFGYTLVFTLVLVLVLVVLVFGNRIYTYIQGAMPAVGYGVFRVIGLRILVSFLFLTFFFFSCMSMFRTANRRGG